MAIEYQNHGNASLVAFNVRGAKSHPVSYEPTRIRFHPATILPLLPFSHGDRPKFFPFERFAAQQAITELIHATNYADTIEPLEAGIDLPRSYPTGPLPSFLLKDREKPAAIISYFLEDPYHPQRNKVFVAEPAPRDGVWNYLVFDPSTQPPKIIQVAEGVSRLKSLTPLRSLEIAPEYKTHRVFARIVAENVLHSLGALGVTLPKLHLDDQPSPEINYITDNLALSLQRVLETLRPPSETRRQTLSEDVITPDWIRQVQHDNPQVGKITREFPAAPVTPPFEQTAIQPPELKKTVVQRAQQTREFEEGEVNLWTKLRSTISHRLDTAREFLETLWSKLSPDETILSSERAEYNMTYLHDLFKRAKRIVPLANEGERFLVQDDRGLAIAYLSLFPGGKIIITENLGKSPADHRLVVRAGAIDGRNVAEYVDQEVVPRDPHGQYLHFPNTADTTDQYQAMKKAILQRLMNAISFTLFERDQASPHYVNQLDMQRRQNLSMCFGALNDMFLGERSVTDYKNTPYTTHNNDSFMLVLPTREHIIFQQSPGSPLRFRIRIPDAANRYSERAYSISHLGKLVSRLNPAQASDALYYISAAYTTFAGANLPHLLAQQRKNLADAMQRMRLLLLTNVAEFTDLNVTMLETLQREQFRQESTTRQRTLLQLGSGGRQSTLGWRAQRS